MDTSLCSTVSTECIISSSGASEAATIAVTNSAIASSSVVPALEAATTAVASRSLIATIVGFLPRLLFRIISKVSLFFYRILTWSFTVHLNFSSLLTILVVLCIGAYLVIRYRYLNKYSRLKSTEPAQSTSSFFDLHPDDASEDEYYYEGIGGRGGAAPRKAFRGPGGIGAGRPYYKTYPDEFLSAFLSSIKIFGYLEQHVFHELARHLQTKKLLAGDTLFRQPEQEKSFYIVVHGHVQLFVKPDDDPYQTMEGSDEEEDEEEGRDMFENYTLINEVGAGGTLSSLFTILSVFRESFMRQESKRHKIQPSSSSNTANNEELGGWRSVFPNLQEASGPGNSNRSLSLQHQHPLASSAKRSASSTDITASDDDDLMSSSAKMLASPVAGSPSLPAAFNTSINAKRRYRSVHPNIVARATVDTTLAVIPEEAFHKLTQKFPKAAAHIVQVILTRFQRVTLMTGHRYLGLTKELLRLERLASESASMDELPQDLFVPGGIERLRRKFAHQQNDDAPSGHDDVEESPSSGIIQAMDIPSTPSLGSKGGDSSSAVGSPLHHQQMMGATSPSNTPYHHHHHHHHHHHQEEYSVKDDEHLRASVRRCFAECLGISAQVEPPSLQNSTSSPMSSSSKRQHHHHHHPQQTDALKSSSRYYYPMDLFSPAGTADTSASPSLGALSVPYDDDIDNVSTVSSSAVSATGGQYGEGEALSANDVQILFFPQDAVLLKEDEHNNGLFFVIDGVLDVSMTPAATEDLSLERPTQPYGVSSPTSVPKKKKNKKKKQQKTRFSLSPIPSPTLSPSTSSDDFSGDHEQQQQQQKSQLANVAPALEGTSIVDKHGPVMASRVPAGRAPPHADAETYQERKAQRPLFTIKPGGIAGYLEALTGHPSFVEIRAKTDTYVGYLSRKSLDRIIDKHPTVMLKLAQRLVTLLSPLVLHIDLALDWMQVNSGQVICHEGQPSDSIYMVLHGRLRTIHGEKGDGGIEILGEFGRGDCVCELEALAGIPAPATLHAIRDSELARLPKTLFNALARRHPEITLQISRMVAIRSLQMTRVGGGNGGAASSIKSSSLPQKSQATLATLSGSAAAAAPDQAPELYGRNNANLKTVGIIPVNASVPVTEFAENLKSALMQAVGATCVLLNSATITSVMGKHAFSQLGKLKLASWLAEQEEKYRIVLYLADSGVKTQWTRTCIRQADSILLVGLGDGDPAVGDYERFLINMKTTARKELVLLHGERFCATGTTQNWLKNRLWIQAHHHIFMPMRKHATLSNERGGSARPPWLAQTGRKMTENSINMMRNVKGQLEKYYPTFGRLLVVKKNTATQFGSASNAARDDFARLARRLCGKSVALVLGGGGARGITHIGMIQALEEANIPIDIIGGTSIGSFVGGLYAKNRDLVSTIARSKMFSSRTTSLWRNLMDLTYPVTAWFTGHSFNRSIFKCLGDSQIEDFWLPYFAVTTNITWSRMEVHTTGYAWRYIRASMSLSGYMPPICNENGHMLVDGGYMDNLPVSVAKSMGADIIIAVDVASEDDTSPVRYGDSISGWWALLYNLNPFRSYTIPSIAEIQSRLAYVSSVSKLEEAKVTDGVLYVKLPVQNWGTLEFNKFPDIMQLGYDAGKQVVGAWRKAGYASGRLLQEQQDAVVQQQGKEVKGTRGRRNSI
ncbi:hypothetical protein BDB00DRAFT_877065 [Zychaea mexicana]|uniref:uncharacterized protein n=1 Tax=Zychaea mexicana TaxID=64656 RepID=UPI0022FDD3ED|nr:uncharacterized protein BDB00DRAFT_877065 [Zychaea mexicana]KAI9488797.1 hypothetical protein BDB00DRAFT_877065 [Zychaea mexicana]